MRIRRNDQVEMAPMKNETVLFNPENNKFCVLNVTSALIWQQLEVPRTAEELLESMLAGFSDVNVDVAKADILKVVDELIEIECVSKV